MHYVYLLQLSSGNIYSGQTSDLKRRMQEHTDGKVQSTAPYRPFQLVYYEAFCSKTDALRRETYLKTSTGKRMVKLLLRDSLKK
ncbi:MAG TPA: excinuclease ABC subunit C [Candidatus Magasanikbacteria bacterium]|nr:MAG: hypothetical protein UW10_C0007G0032 [Candidatus Magasanikbacteria bacterium GW2011_GWA2_43_9]HBB38400.1 excinuclease ABC subunit C [Candidatus Magasanikbacteria bacterium]HCC14167.1 excinuclease ABC subunit C [Candidatus Magasanikbacteria bacterium]